MESELHGSYVQSSGLTTGRPSIQDGSEGPESRYANRDYGDGFVYMDPGTGDPNAVDPDTTWYWGYQDGSQYSQADNTLKLRATGAREITRDVLQDSREEEETFDGWGLEIAGEWPIAAWGRAEITLTAGLRGFLEMGHDHSCSTYHERIDTQPLTVVDTYEFAGANFPAAPYAGTYDGPFDTPPVIPSPVIPNKPSSRRAVPRGMSTTHDAFNQIDLDVDAELYELRLGPAVSASFRDGRLRASFSPAVTFSVLDIEASRGEQWIMMTSDGNRQTLQSWSDHASDTEALWGVGVTAVAEYALHGQSSLALSLSMDWVQSVDMQMGPSRLETDVGGYTVGLAFVHAFGGQAPADE